MPNASLPTLTKRADFLAASRSEHKFITPAFILQIRKRDGGPARVGFTASRKIGGAVQRNFAKRRLRALTHQVLAPIAQEGTDYVFVARDKMLSRDFAKIVQDLAGCRLNITN